jgi:hypothetical protein
LLELSTFALTSKEASGSRRVRKAELNPWAIEGVFTSEQGEDWVGKGGWLLGIVVTGTTLAMEAPAALAQEMQRVPVRLSAFLPRSPLPLDLKHMTSDDDGAGCRGIPGTCHGRCENDEFCGTLVSGDGKRYCGCRADHP